MAIKIGDKINGVTVIRRIGKKRSYFNYECKCDCGRSFEANASQFNRNKHTTCKECNKTARLKNSVNIGDKFGLWTVISTRDDKDNYSCMCRCDCGVTKKIDPHHLKAGNTKGCIGCSGLSRSDLVGKNLNGSKVIRYSHTHKGSSFWVVRCDCGTEYTRSLGTISWRLRRGSVSSCGLCTKRRKEINRYVPGREKLDLESLAHDPSSYPVIKIWRKILSRCYNVKDPKYKDYGGRGITVSKAWRLSAAAFSSDIGNRPSLKHTVDRIDNNSGYSKGNCRWSTPYEQSRNTRANNLFIINGKRFILADAAKVLNINSKTLADYLTRHTKEEAIKYYSNKQ